MRSCRTRKTNRTSFVIFHRARERHRKNVNGSTTDASKRWKYFTKTCAAEAAKFTRQLIAIVHWNITNISLESRSNARRLLRLCLPPHNRVLKRYTRGNVLRVTVERYFFARFVNCLQTHSDECVSHSSGCSILGEKNLQGVCIVGAWGTHVSL